jgi:hypothetical protein
MLNDTAEWGYLNASPIDSAAGWKDGLEEVWDTVG